MYLTANMMLRSFRHGHSLFVDSKEPRKLAQRVVDSLEVVTPGLNVPVRFLSGGNVQKVLVGREIASTPTVLLTAYAVRGLDINSSYTIYELSDRILVLCDGEVSAVLDGRKADKKEVGLYMTHVGGGTDGK